MEADTRAHFRASRQAAELCSHLRSQPRARRGHDNRQVAGSGALDSGATSGRVVEVSTGQTQPEMATTAPTEPISCAPEIAPEMAPTAVKASHAAAWPCPPASAGEPVGTATVNQV